MCLERSETRLPASTKLVLQLLRIDDPVLRRAEGFLDARLVNLQDDFIARFESEFLRDLTRYNDAQGRSPLATTGSRAWHGLPVIRLTYISGYLGVPSLVGTI